MSFARPEPADFRIQDKVVKGHLRRLSATGGYASFQGNMRGGMLAEIAIPTPHGRICGLVELLEPKGRSIPPSDLAFRFVGLDDHYYERLTAALQRLR